MKRMIAWILAAGLVLCLWPFGGVTVLAATVDLEVTELNWNTATEVAPGTAVTFSATVKNNGSSAVTAPFTVEFGTANTVFASVVYEGGVAAKSSVTVKAKPWTAVLGDHMVAVRVNTTGSVAESSTKNNTKQSNLRVANDTLKSSFSSTQKLMEDNGLTTLIFSDDFNDLSTVDTTDSGKAGYKWYVDRPYGAKTLTTADYSVKDGVMSLHNEIPTYNYGLGTYHPDKRVGFSYNLGYMEIRLRIPRPRKNESDEKGVPAIWALPPEKLTNSAKAWVEMDWMEYWGINGYNSNRPGGFYTVCLHEQHLTGTTVTTHFKNRNYTYEGLGDGDWHVMGWLWQEGLFITYLDGLEVMRQTYGKGEDPMPLPTIEKGSELPDIYTMLDTQFNPIIIGGSKDNPMELDYVRVWNGNRTASPEPITEREMTAKEFVDIYLSDDEGNPVKVVTEDTSGYIVISEQEWNKLSAATKAEVEQLLAKNGQPTYAKLLASAKKLEADEEEITTTEQPTTTVPVTTKKPAAPTVVQTPDGVTEPSVTKPTAADTETTVTDTETTVEATDATVTVGSEPTQPTDTEPAAAFPWVAVLVPVGAAVLAAAVVLLIKFRKK